MTEHSADTVELKPCPFCGNDGSGPVEDALQICEIDMEGQWKAPFAYSVQCDKCTATMGYSESADAAVEAWNTRTALTVEDAAKVLLENDPHPDQYAIYGADRTDRYAKGFCGGVEATIDHLRAIADTPKEGE